ncbi:MAG: hypothetical protein JXA66_00390 [Oligoflexia bacterium]|nr:hypothetical protein [Oligoflexia bacterium]
MRIPCRDFSEDTFKVIGEISSVAKRLSVAIRKKRDPVDALSALETKVDQLRSELSMLMLEKNRGSMLQFIRDFYDETGEGIGIVLPEHGINAKLLSAVSEIILLIAKKINKSINMLSLVSADGTELSCTLNNLDYSRLKDTPLPRVVSRLDGHILDGGNNTSSIRIPNVFGTEKFLILNSCAGHIAVSAVAVANRDSLVESVFGRKFELEIIAGVSRTGISSIPVAVEESIRQMPESVFGKDIFRGVFISSQGLPVPVINIAGLCENKDRFKWL